MKNLKKAIALCLALLLCLTCPVVASAAEANESMIDEEPKASLTIWKYDWTNAYKDGVWNEDSFISTGWRESYVEDVLGGTVREGDSNGEIDNPLGNGQNSNGYAIKGVGYTITRVANIVTFSEPTNDQHPDYNLTMVLYGFDKEKSADLLAAIGLPNGEGRYVDIFVDYDYDHLCDVYSKDILGVLQNDPHYCFGNAQPMSMTDADGGYDLHLTGIPQKYLGHYFLTATATVDFNDVTMQAQDGSKNAVAPLTVVNTKGFDLPQTGDSGVMVFTVTGIVMMAGALLVIVLASKKNSTQK